MDGQHGLAVVVLTLQHRPQLQPGQTLLERQDLLPPLLLEVGVLLLPQELAQFPEFLPLRPQ